METWKNHGGPAFPVQGYDVERNVVIDASKSGMSLRDYFASKAMQEVFAQNWTRGDFTDEARRAYKMADAMLAERAK